jgi:hypothetical protein
MARNLATSAPKPPRTAPTSGPIRRWARADTLSYAQSILFNPLSIAKHEWELDAQGYHNGGAGLALRARDRDRDRDPRL